MDTCPNCAQPVTMVNDSYLSGATFHIMLECPRCDFIFVGAVALKDLEQVKPVKDR